MKIKYLFVIVLAVILLTGMSLSSPVINAATNQPIPGQIEAESYSAMSGIQTENCSEGGQDVGWIDAGDWLDYSLNVQTSGTYSVDFRVASPYANTQFQLKNGATVLATITVPNTGGFQTWTTVTATGVNLTAGAQTLRVNAVTNGWNINWLKFNLNGTSTPTPTPTLAPTPTPTPGRILATIVSATASSAIQPASYSCDGNTGTRWESTQGVDPQWIYWDLGSSKSLSRIIIDWKWLAQPLYCSRFN